MIRILSIIVLQVSALLSHAGVFEIQYNLSAGGRSGGINHFTGGDVEYFFGVSDSPGNHTLLSVDSYVPGLEYSFDESEFDLLIRGLTDTARDYQFFEGLSLPGGPSGSTSFRLNISDDSKAMLAGASISEIFIRPEIDYSIPGSDPNGDGYWGEIYYEQFSLFILSDDIDDRLILLTPEPATFALFFLAVLCAGFRSRISKLHNQN